MSPTDLITLKAIIRALADFKRSNHNSVSPEQAAELIADLSEATVTAAIAVLAGVGVIVSNGSGAAYLGYLALTMAQNVAEAHTGITASGVLRQIATAADAAVPVAVTSTNSNAMKGN